jgi:hypothetical protein
LLHVERLARGDRRAIVDDDDAADPAARRECMHDGATQISSADDGHGGHDFGEVL